ncbi:hypothetical protein Scep_004273 [Stephania cephalantha]|uniref:Uncharacterized protein n=1 Tax=Stephania cephalantha TaxID=152367 RepID=A0AAP0KTR4_9MAGN
MVTVYLRYERVRAGGRGLVLNPRFFLVVRRYYPGPWMFHSRTGWAGRQGSLDVITSFAVCAPVTFDMGVAKGGKLTSPIGLQVSEIPLDLDGTRTPSPEFVWCLSSIGETIGYKIHLMVKDTTGTTTFVLFNKQDENLFDTSANKLISCKSEQHPNTLPIQISNLCGKTFIFKIKLNNYNLRDGFENYCITKVFHVNETIESSYKTQLTKKVDDDAKHCDVEQDTYTATANDKVSSKVRKLTFINIDEESCEGMRNKKEKLAPF